MKNAKRKKDAETDLIFGGSFNPPHLGHLIVAQDALEFCRAKKVLFVPANLQPLKGKLEIPAELRLELLKAAVSDNDRFYVWDVEIKRGGISYTVDTLRFYVETYKRKPFLLVGDDSFLSFHLWKDFEEILNLSRIIVAKRETENRHLIEYSLGRLKLKRDDISFGFNESAKICVMSTRVIQISSSEIRKRLKEGRSVRYLVPQKVEEILKKLTDDLNFTLS